MPLFSLCHHLYQIPVLSSISKSYRVPFLRLSECLHSHSPFSPQGQIQMRPCFFKGEHNEALWRHGFQSDNPPGFQSSSVKKKKKIKSANKRSEGEKKIVNLPRRVLIRRIQNDAYSCLRHLWLSSLSQVQVQPARQQLRVRQGEAGLRVRAQYHGVRLQPLQEALPRKSLECGLLPPHTQRNGKYM